MRTDRKYKFNASLALQLNVRWLWRLLWIFIRIDVLILLLGAAGLIVVGEHETSQAWQVFQQQSEIRLPGIETGSRRPEDLTGFNLPKCLAFLYEDTPATIQRTIGPLPAAPQSSNLDQQLNGWYYTRVVMAGNETFLISYFTGGYVRNFLVPVTILLLFEILLMFSNIFTGARIARQVLRPIANLAQQTSDLQNENQPTGTSSLQALAGTISSIDAEKLSTRIDVGDTQEELKELALAINTMLDRITEAYQNQAQFVSDASHELKTPIAVIQGYINLLDRWGKNDKNTLQESIDAIKSETERMKNLTGDLLFLARGGSTDLKKEPIDAGELMGEVYRESTMIDSDHRWQCKPLPDRVMIQGDADLLKQALRVLVDNAIKYTPAGAGIVLQLRTENGYAQLSVQDEGVGIPAEDLPHVFKRFFRSDPSRTRKTGGSGLGLAIADWIVERHGGHFEILSREGIGTRITMCLKQS